MYTRSNIFFRPGFPQSTKALSLLLALCILIRLLSRLIWQPTLWNDSASYIELAWQIRHWDFSHYDGIRTPGYPLLLLLSNMNYWGVWALQAAMGIAVSAMLFLIALRQTKHIMLSFVIGLSYSLCLNILSFEASILTETFSTFLLVLSVLVYQRTVSESRFSHHRLLLLSFISSVAILTRPALLFLIPIYLAFILLARNISLPARIKSAAMYLAPLVLLVGGWCWFNQLKLHYFGVSTVGGMNGLCVAGVFIERAPEEYSDIRDIYLKYRPQCIKKTGRQNATICYAWPEMLQKTQLSPADLSRRVSRLGTTLILHNPLRYLKEVGMSWPIFWKPQGAWKLSAMRFPRLVTFLWGKQQSYLETIAALFLLITGVAIYRILFHRRSNLPQIEILMVTMVLLSSIIHSLIIGGLDNGRYVVPFQAFIMYVVIVSIGRVCFRVGSDVCATAEPESASALEIPHILNDRTTW